MTSEDLYLQVVTRYLPSVLLQNQMLVKSIEDPYILKEFFERVFICNNVQYPKTEGTFKVEPFAEYSSENRIFLVSIPVVASDIGGYPYVLLAVAQETIRFFLVSSNKINFRYCLWELEGDTIKNCGEVSENKNNIIGTVFKLIH